MGQGIIATVMYSRHPVSLVTDTVINSEWQNETGNNITHFVPSPPQRKDVYKIYSRVMRLRNGVSGRIDLESTYSDLHYSSWTWDQPDVEKPRSGFPSF
jgi:hypothetical protein